MPSPYRLIRSQRRTLAIEIDGTGALIVRAPARMPLAEIERFLAQKSAWITSKQALAHACAQGRDVPVLAQGETFAYLGGALCLRLCDTPIGIDYHGALLLPPGGDLAAKARAWRTRRAVEWLTPRVKAWAERMELAPATIAFTNARKRWGSMSGRRNLRLNSALIHCPPELCDYVIVHELAHIAHPDHSHAFHAHVARYLPDASARRERLKALSSYLNWPNPAD
ncbi:MAG: SprT family zinc-dependent metalloprotease [Clostridia bacterium]